MLRSFLIAAALLASTPASAQSVSTVRGAIETISPDGSTLNVRTRAGQAASVHLAADARVTLIVPASLADLKAGAYIGVGAAPAADGVLQALEVHVFPEALRGAGEGFRPFDLTPDSTMTNGALTTRVEDVKGPMLTVTYAGGSKEIRIAPDTPIVTFEPGARSDLKVGAKIIARGPKGADGAVEAARVSVGKDGLTPPM
jgi:hypothetical protein